MKEALHEVGKQVAELIVKELQDQKHILTGAIADIDIDVDEVADGYTIRLLMQPYSRFVDQGVPANRIPFSPPTGRGGTSEYIEGLRRFAELRGMSNPLSAAFAIAQTQKGDDIKEKKGEGMPTQGSRKLAARRTGFIDYIVNIHSNTIKEEISKALQQYVEVEIINIFAKHEAIAI